MPLADVFALTLYRRLFEQAPRLRELFQADIAVQGHRVFEGIDRAVSALDDWGALEPVLVSLGRRHGYVGVQAGDFSDLEIALHRTFQDLLGTKYGPEARQAWEAFLSAIAGAMIQGIRSVEEEVRRCDTTRFFRNPGGMN